MVFLLSQNKSLNLRNLKIVSCSKFLHSIMLSMMCDFF